MRSYQGIVLSLGLLTHTTLMDASAQEQETPANPTEDAAPNLSLPPAAIPPVPDSEVLQPKATPLINPTPLGTPGAILNPASPVGPSSSDKSKKLKAKGSPKKVLAKIKRKELADSLLKRRGAADSEASIVGEAQTLPKQAIRMRYIVRTATAEKGFDGSGKSQNLGASLAVVGQAIAVEYGISDRWTVQMIAPYASSNELALNANTFKQSSEFEREYQKIMDAVAPSLMASGVCASAEACRTAIDNGLKLPVATPVELPSGEVAIVAANVPIREAANSLILNAARPSSGETGLGDVQLGLGYNAINSQRHVLTVGLGMRLPTGRFTDVPVALRAPGSGFLAAGLVLKYDLRLSRLILSFSEQMEYALGKAKRSRSSMIDPSLLNAADTATNDPNIAGAGDGLSNSAAIERKGLYHEGWTRIAYPLGAFTRYLRPAAVYAYYNWIIDPEYQNAGQVQAKAKELYSASYAFSIDGLAMDPVIPASFSYRHEIPISGRNVALAPTSDFFQLNLYYKF